MEEKAMRSGEVKYWEPKGPEVLRGVFEFYEGLNQAVRTEDGTIWLLDADAEEQLRRLQPNEGQDVQVMYIEDALGEPRFHVSLH